jgi:hypothetical protein
MYWFRRLMQDDYFANKLRCRWTQLRSTIFTTAKMMTTIDSIAAVLEEPQARNYQRWPILGTYVWPNQYVFNTYQEEVNFLKEWIVDRLEWMDDYMPGSGPCNPITAVDPEFENSVVAYPNPSSGNFHFTVPQGQGRYSISIFNSIGTRIFSIVGITKDVLLWSGKDDAGVPAASGLYTVVIQSSDNKMFTTKIVKE